MQLMVRPPPCEPLNLSWMFCNFGHGGIAQQDDSGAGPFLGDRLQVTPELFDGRFNLREGPIT